MQAAALLCALVSISWGAQGPAETTGSVQVILEPSQQRLTAGRSLALTIDAHLQNLFDKPIYIKPTEVYLQSPVEIGPRNYWRADFITEDDPDKGIPRDKQNIVLKSGSSYAIRFRISALGDNDQTLTDWLRANWRYVSFAPGEYKFEVVGKYWKDAEMKGDGYTTFVYKTMIPVAAPQFVILLGAAIGGAIAYLLPRLSAESRSRRNTGWKAIGNHLLRIVASAIWSVAIVLLLSRISEKQFVITITANDVWGAIVLGIVAHYVGKQVLDSLGTPKSAKPKEG